MSRNRCSRCHQVGHNRRNKHCENIRKFMELSAELNNVFVIYSNALTDIRLYICLSLTIIYQMSDLIASFTLAGYPNPELELSLRNHILNVNNAIELIQEQFPHVQHPFRRIILGYNKAINSRIEYPNLRMRRVFWITNTTSLEPIPRECITPCDAFVLHINEPNNRHLAFAGIIARMMVVYFPQTTATSKRTSHYIKELSVTFQEAEEAEEPIVCSICYDDVEASNAVVTNCLHKYCVDCINSQSTAIKDKTIKPTCPCCRTELTEFKSGSRDICEKITNHIHML